MALLRLSLGLVCVVCVVRVSSLSVVSKGKSLRVSNTTCDHELDVADVTTAFTSPISDQEAFALSSGTVRTPEGLNSVVEILGIA